VSRKCQPFWQPAWEIRPDESDGGQRKGVGVVGDVVVVDAIVCHDGLASNASGLGEL